MVANIWNISNPHVVATKFSKYKGHDDATLGLSHRANKKYCVVLKTATGRSKTIHFGSTLPDFTKHKDEARRQRYLARAQNIKGTWRENKYSPNMLAINLLW